LPRAGTKLQAAYRDYAFNLFSVKNRYFKLCFQEYYRLLLSDSKCFKTHEILHYQKFLEG
jgi:hypothetical protein